MPPTNSITVAQILERFPPFFSETIGDLNARVSGVNTPELANSGEMSFLANPKAFAAGLKSQASVFVVSSKSKDQIVTAQPGRTILVSSNPEKAMALVISAFFRATPYTNASVQSTHPTATIGENSKIARSARIGPHAFIGTDVTICENAYIGANAVVEDGCFIGVHTVIHPLAFIGHSTQIGARCEVHPNAVVGKEGFGYAHDEQFNHTRIPHQGIVVLENDVHVGACTTIDRGTFGETRISAGTIIDNLVHIAHNCRVGRNSVLVSGFTMAGSGKVGANFVTGGKTVISGHIEVADNVQLAALSAVSKSIPVAGQYGGSPIQPLQKFLKTKATLPHLPQMRKSIQRILKHLGLEDETSSDV